MAITGAIVHVANVDRAVDFYVGLLDAEVIGIPSETSAELDFMSARIRVVRLDGGRPSGRHDDDLYRGFRHIGFKVGDAFAFADRLTRAGVPIMLGPVYAEAGAVNIAFFRDPDGTVLEVVDGHLQYEQTFDVEAAQRERERATPARPRFDHIAQTCRDFGAAAGRLEKIDFHRIGRLRHASQTGFTLDYFRSGDSVLEVFTFSQATVSSEPRLDSYGFVAAEFDLAERYPAETLGRLPDGTEIVVDSDDLTSVRIN